MTGESMDSARVDPAWADPAWADPARAAPGSRAWLAATAVSVLSLLLGATAAGCTSIEPDVGAPLRDLCVNEDSDPDTDVSFSRDILQGIFNDENLACNECHSLTGATPIGVEVGGLDLSDRANLLSGGVVSGVNIVVPGQPCDSVLVQKVSAGPPFGSRMPFDGPPFLDAVQRQLLSDWIAEGARDN